MKLTKKEALVWGTLLFCVGGIVFGAVTITVMTRLEGGCQAQGSLRNGFTEYHNHSDTEAAKAVKEVSSKLETMDAAMKEIGSSIKGHGLPVEDLLERACLWLSHKNAATTTTTTTTTVPPPPPKG